ncbi:MAG: hypothetical protein E6J64_15265, partial [Deltaproteobacteria bacterium]
MGSSCERDGFRLVHFSVQSNHLHLSVQARDALALARGVQALSIRVAKAVNRVLERHGKVFADRSSSVTFARAPRRVPGAGERAFRVRGQITLGSRLLFRGESRATTARIPRRAQGCGSGCFSIANESRCAGLSHL